MSARGVHAGLVALLLAVHAVLATVSALGKSPAYDEVPHLTAGYSYWKYADFRLHPENGNLAQRWAALPVFLDPATGFPDVDEEPWRKPWKRSDCWSLGDAFLHRVGNDPGRMLLLGRAAVTVVGLLVCFLVYWCARMLCGPGPALLSLFLAAFSPTLIAHGQLVTSDLFLTLFLMLGAWTLWVCFERVCPGRLLGSAVAAGTLFLAKTSAVLYLPLAAILTGIRLLQREPLWIRSLPGREKALSTLPGKAAALAGILAFHGLVIWVMIWAAHGFQYRGFRPPEPRYFKLRTLDRALERTGGLAAPLRLLAEHHLLPEPYLFGTAWVFAHAERRRSYLAGEYSLSGFRSYLPTCALVKTPLPLFALLGLAVLRRRRSGTTPVRTGGFQGALRHPALPLVTLFAVYAAAAFSSTLNIGHRHLLPLYPLLFVFAARAAVWLRRPRTPAALLVAVCLVWFGAESLRAYPDYLAYFNQLVDRDRADRLLVDSNLDWGQDLPGLAAYLEERTAGGHPTGPLYLAYFGKGVPEVYGIEARRLPGRDPGERLRPLEAGTYCVSATALRNVYGDFPGRWNREYEDRYQTLRGWFAQNRESLAAAPPEAAARTLAVFDELRVQRLLAYLRQREPDAVVHHTVHVHDLAAGEIEQALEAPPAELDEFSWIQSENLQLEDPDDE